MKIQEFKPYKNARSKNLKYKNKNKIRIRIKLIVDFYYYYYYYLNLAVFIKYFNCVFIELIFLMMMES